MISVKLKAQYKAFKKGMISVQNTHKGGNMNLYLDFDGVIVDSIKVTYKMME